MRFLLDTCTALWMWHAPERLPDAVRETVTFAGNDVIFHQVSSLEIQIKHSLGKLTLPDVPGVFIPRAVSEHFLTYQPLLDDDIFLWEKLPRLHDDPFDRILVAHAIVSGATLLTPDKRIAEYPVRVLWG